MQLSKFSTIDTPPIMALVQAAMLAALLLAAAPGQAAADMEKKGVTPYVTHFVFRPVQSLDVPGPDAEPSPEPDMEALTELVERAINGIELPDYAGVPDSAAPAGPPITSSPRP